MVECKILAEAGIKIPLSTKFLVEGVSFSSVVRVVHPICLDRDDVW
jgi:hypothetical protein